MSFGKNCVRKKETYPLYSPFILTVRTKRQNRAINLHLYHYAGNNPVRYTDPDGTKERSDIENLIMMMDDGKSTGKECFNEAENIAAKEAKVGMQEIPAAMEEGLLGGMKIMTDHGAEISLLCYASGEIELGGIIDGVSFACDITSAYHEYKETGDAKKFTKEATTSLAFTLVGNGCSNAITKNVLKNFKLSSKEFKNFVESSSNIIVGLLSLDVSKLQE